MNVQILSLVLLLASIVATAQNSVTLTPSDDTYLFWHKSKTSNHGKEPFLKVRFAKAGEFRRDAMIKFAIDPSVVKLPVKSVQLRLYGKDGYVECPVALLRIRHDATNYHWDESSVNGENRPQTDYSKDEIARTRTLGNNKEGWLVWESDKLLNYVNNELQAGRNSIGFHIRQMPENGVESYDEMQFHAKEKAKGSPAELILSF